MNPFLQGFTDELEKLGGVIRGTLRAARKYPGMALTLGLGGAVTGVAGYMGHKGALRPGEKPRVLLARPGQPGRYHNVNYNRFFRGPGKKRVGKHHKPELIRR